MACLSSCASFSLSWILSWELCFKSLSCLWGNTKWKQEKSNTVQRKRSFITAGVQAAWFCFISCGAYGRGWGRRRVQPGRAKRWWCECDDVCVVENLHHIFWSWATILCCIDLMKRITETTTAVNKCVTLFVCEGATTQTTTTCIILLTPHCQCSEYVHL